MLQGMDLRLEIRNFCYNSRFRFLAFGRKRVPVICHFLLNDEDLAIEVIHDGLERSQFLRALGFDVGSQVSDFEDVNLCLSLGYLGSCLDLFCIRRYAERLEGRAVGKSKGGRFLLSKDVWHVVGVSIANTSV